MYENQRMRVAINLFKQKSFLSDVQLHDSYLKT